MPSSVLPETDSPGLIGADQVALDDIAGRAGGGDDDAIGIAAQNVAGGGRGSSDRVVRCAIDQDAGAGLFPRIASPVALVPIKFPSTRLSAAPEPVSQRPEPILMSPPP